MMSKISVAPDFVDFVYFEKGCSCEKSTEKFQFIRSCQMCPNLHFGGDSQFCPESALKAGLFELIYKGKSQKRKR